MEKLTQKELQVLQLLCLSNKEIAQILWLSNGTVKNYIESLLRKFGSKSRTTILIKALKAGVLTLDEVVTK